MYNLLQTPPRPLRLLASCLALGCATAPRPLASSECAGSGLPALAVLHHAVELSLRLVPPSLVGRAELRLRAVRDTALLALDASELKVSSVSTADGELRFQIAGGRLCAELPAPLRAGEELLVRVDYQADTGRPVPAFSRDQVWAGYAAWAWLPTLRDPSQRATLDLVLTAPIGLAVAASGRAAASEPVGTGAENLVRHHFLLDRPSPTFLLAFAAGHFDEAKLEVDGVTLRALGPPGAALQGALELTAPMLRFFTERLGIPYPAPAYTQVFVEGDAAQEAAGLSFLGAGALDDVKKDPTEDWIFSHELAHQWFAWLVPCADFADFWLNEGFATFLVATYKEQRWGPGAYARERSLWIARSDKVHAAGKDAPLSLSGPGSPFVRRGPKESELQARGITYSRGALLLDLLRRELGEAVFWDGVRRYVKTRAGLGARSEDLRAALEAASGKDLKLLFAERVYAPWFKWE